MSIATENEAVGVQASATTENIQEIQETPAPTGKTPHNHKPNFGRKVAGCPRCQEIQDEKASAIPTPQAQTAAPLGAPTPVMTVTAPPAAPVMSMDQVLELVKALREPDDETKAKRKAEKEFNERRTKEMIELARIEMEQKQLLQSNCSHRKQNGQSTIGGQVHSDGLYHPICTRCGYQPEPSAPPTGTLVGGLQ